MTYKNLALTIVVRKMSFVLLFKRVNPLIIWNNIKVPHLEYDPIFHNYLTNFESNNGHENEKKT